MNVSVAYVAAIMLFVFAAGLLLAWWQGRNRIKIGNTSLWQKLGAVGAAIGAVVLILLETFSDNLFFIIHF